jgi:heme A synthase
MGDQLARKAASPVGGRLVTTLAAATTVATYALVVLGSTVRVTSSGMGCPSWPLCFGKVGPIDEYHALLEQSHRYLVVLVTLGVVATALAARRSRVARAAFAPAAVATVLVLVQAALGALTVLAKNAPWTVAVHLVVGLTFFATTVVTTVVALRCRHGRCVRPTIGPWGVALLAAVLAVVVAGSLVVANNAGGSCAAWPACPPGAPASSGWQLLHRSLAGIAGVVFLGFLWVERRARFGGREGAVLAGATAGAFALVAGLGAASALSRAAPAWQDAHLAAVALLVLLVVATVVTIATAPGRSSSQKGVAAGEAVGDGAGPAPGHRLGGARITEANRP